MKASFRSISSELLKITTLRSIWVSMGIFAVTATAITYFICYYSDSEAALLDSTIVTGGVNLYALFAIMIGAFAVTSEYASNTMRTTLLARPGRIAAYAEKAVASVVFYGISLLVVMGIAMAAGSLASGKGWDLAAGNGLALVNFWIGNLLLVLMTVAVAYIVRGTAGTIISMVFVLWIVQMLTLIPSKFFQNTLPPYFPSNVLVAMTSNDAMQYYQGFNFVGRSEATLILVAYTAVITVIAVRRFARSDA